MTARLTVDPKFLQLFLDEKFTKKIIGRDTDTLALLKIKYVIRKTQPIRNGDMIHVANPDTKFAPGVVAGGAPT